MDKFSVIKSSAVSLTTANKSYLIPGYPIPNRNLLIIYNSTNYTVYIGGSDVTTSNGLPISSGDYVIINIPNFVYAICGTATQTIRILELG